MTQHLAPPRLAGGSIGAGLGWAEKSQARFGLLCVYHCTRLVKQVIFKERERECEMEEREGEMVG